MSEGTIIEHANFFMCFFTIRCVDVYARDDLDNLIMLGSRCPTPILMRCVYDRNDLNVLSMRHARCMLEFFVSISQLMHRAHV